MIKHLILTLGAACATLSACTAWILAPNANETGAYVLHKTRDWGKGDGGVPVTLEALRPNDSKYRLLAFSPYMLFNEKGLGMVDTSAPSTTDNTPDLDMFNIGTTMARVAFNCATVQEALAMLEEFIKEAPYPKNDNYLLCDTKEAVIIELAPKHIAYRKVTDGFAVHTNHFIYPEILFISKGKLESNIKSATRLLITQGKLAAHLQEQGVINLADSLALSRFQDKENYPDVCPFRNTSVCAADYIPDREFPGILGTIRVCPGPPRYAPAIPVSLGTAKVPETLRNGEFGKLAFRLKFAFLDREDHLPQLEQLEQRFWKEYLAAHAKAKELLKANEPDASSALLQNLLDSQVQEAFALIQSLLQAE